MKQTDSKTHTLWVERYRPTSLDEYVGNDQLKQKISIYLKSGDVPHLLLFAPPGTGKTTLAKIISKTIDCDTMYINASDENSVDVMRTKIKDFSASAGFKPLKIIILDEADYLSPNAQAALRNLMEVFSRHTRFILTCNYAERIIEPIQSRCQMFKVIPPSKQDVAVRVKTILDAENVKYKLEDVAELVTLGYPDIRRVINSVQRQVVSGKLVIDKQTLIQNDYKLKLLEHLIQDNKSSAFKNIRQLLADSQIQDYTDLYKYLYDEIDKYAKGHIAPVILIIADAQIQDQYAIDKEIHIMSMVIKILNEIKE